MRRVELPTELAPAKLNTLMRVDTAPEGEDIARENWNETVSAAREGIGRYINFYNTRRPYSSYQAHTPDVVYFSSLPQPSAEAARLRRVHL